MVVYVRIACEHKRYSPPCFHVVMDLECRIFFSKSIRKVIDVYFKIFEYSGMVVLTIEKLVEPPVKVSPEEHSTPKVAQISPGPITLTSWSMKVTRDAPLLTLNPPLRNTSIYTLAADPTDMPSHLVPLLGCGIQGREHLNWWDIQILLGLFW